jgi:hypothetical protein
MDLEFRRRIIDVFINSVYLYDDKIAIFYNIKGGKQISYIEVSDALGGELYGDPEGLADDGAGVRISSPTLHHSNQIRILRRLARGFGFVVYFVAARFPPKTALDKPREYMIYYR